MNNIQHTHKMIAMEALQVGLPIKLGSPTFLKVKGIAKAISQWAQDKVRPELRIMPVTYNKVKGDLENSSYSDLSGTRITVPRGLKGHLNAYTETLFETFLLVENINKDLLNPFSIWLSLKLTSPGSLADASAVRDLKGYVEVPVTKAQSMLGGFVDPNSRREQADLQTVYPSITIMKTTWDNINALATRYLETNPTKVLKSVNEIAEKIDRLIKVIEAMPEDQAKLSAQSAVVLSGICAQMAEAVDLYGIVGTLVRELSVVGMRNVEEVQPVAKTSGKRRKDMAMESLDLGAGVMLSFDGHAVDYDSLIQTIDRKGTAPVRLPIADFEWVIEENLTEAVVDGDMGAWENQMVYAIQFDGFMYPVANLNVIGLAAAAGHDSIEVVYIDHDALIASLETQN